jgi:hypothetical protein
LNRPDVILEVEEAEAGDWVVLSEPTMVTATGKSLILDNNGGTGAVIEKPLVCT